MIMWLFKGSPWSVITMFFGGYTFLSMISQNSTNPQSSVSSKSPKRGSREEVCQEVNTNINNAAFIIIQKYCSATVWVACQRYKNMSIGEKWIECRQTKLRRAPLRGQKVIANQPWGDTSVYTRAAGYWKTTLGYILVSCKIYCNLDHVTHWMWNASGIPGHPYRLK